MLGCVFLFATVPMTLQGAYVSPASSDSSSADVSSLSHSEIEWVGHQIYRNECASKPENLIYWGDGEAFPSLGIGHFIWYPEGVQGRFHETFPDMLNFVRKYKSPPEWLRSLNPVKAPWASKQALLDSTESNQYKALQTWLLETQAYQARFITLQFQERLNRYFQTHPDKKITHSPLVKRLMSFKEGRFALIDYANFKGVGNVKEQYQGQQWGLISVLDQLMNENEPRRLTTNNMELLSQFVNAAKQRLQLRVELAPAERNEKRWIKGWFKRIDGYKTQTSHQAFD